MSNNIPKVSLSFSKTIEKKKLQTSALGNDNLNIKQEHKQSILLFDKNLKPSEPERPEDSLVIPLVESKRDIVYKNIKEKKTDPSSVINGNSNEKAEMTIDEQAAAAVIEESARKMEELENRSSNDNSFRQNMINIPNLNDAVDMEGVVSTLDDYDQINVQHFGAALLRGMGWSKDQGIGKNKKIVDIINPTNKGLTLTKKEGKQKNPEEELEEEEELKKGCRVLIEEGRNRGTYGMIESVDEDHVLVRTAREDKVLRDVEQNIRIVSAKEYKDFSRVINKNMYDEYKAAELKKRKDKQKEYDKTGSNESKKIKKEQNSRREASAAKQDISARRDVTHSQDIKNNLPRDDKLYDISERQKEKSKKNYDTYDREKDRHDRKEKHMEDKHRCYKEESGKSNKGGKYEKERKKEGAVQSAKNHSLPLPTIPWARENLRVRIIDKEYKGGKYHKEKVIVSSIDTVESCTCISEEGKTLYDVNPHHLETVIPKTASTPVLIIKGNYKGQKARILELQKEKEKATIQLLDESSVILKLYYDDICEYISR